MLQLLQDRHNSATGSSAEKDANRKTLQAFLNLLWGLSSKVVFYRGEGVAHSQLPGAKNKTCGNAFILSDETKPPQKHKRTAAEN